MIIHMTVSECPHPYFPENQEIKVERMTVFADVEKTDEVGYLDFYIDRPNDTTYHLFLYIQPKYRDNWIDYAINPTTGNYFGTTNDVWVNATSDFLEHAPEMFRKGRSNPDMHDPRIFIQGVAERVIEANEFFDQ